uniref:Putative organic anion transporter n=1 Tax=Anopheles darlingi TaxID=43151 RepID=A0A2M4DPC2_ANODA
MSKYMLLLALIGKACSILFFFGAWFYYIPPKALSNGNGYEEEKAGRKLGEANGHAAPVTVTTVEKY